ncbi:hypothetical protein Lmor_1757 [Legionella moravica]|uniref:Transmembrane protein n=1 Tax=Legionella moravica TaxID=39962 RepID=A0A378K3B2_9GAMM|nr:hypothetical protein [Legionella moravica]KTD34360.1 hypothetical protein Lmor_1757 [Legionella moravica]STX64078.1 Uncharacterised protein [Legionella moravica]
MWSIINEWFKRNKSYLTMLFLSSLTVGLLAGILSVIFPPVLFAFSTITLFGITPLAFLTTLPSPLAALALSAIMVGISAGVLAPGIMVVKQLTTIGIHLYALFTHEEQHETDILTTGTYNYFNQYFQPDSYDYVEKDDDEEFYELSSDNSSDDADDSVLLVEHSIDSTESNSRPTLG